MSWRWGALFALSLSLAIGACSVVGQWSARPSSFVLISTDLRPALGVAPPAIRQHSPNQFVLQSQRASGFIDLDNDGEDDRNDEDEKNDPDHIGPDGHPNVRGDHPGEAAAFRRLSLQDENGEIAADGLMAGYRHVQEMRDGQPPPGPDDGAGITRGGWTWLGPGNIGGRVRAIAIHPTTPATMFAGGADGGLWKTTDTGASWAPVDDFMANLAVMSIVFTPGAPAVMYAATGEGFFPADYIRGAGVFKSTDGGTTWSQLASTASTSPWWYVNRLSISPDGLTILAATWQGIYRSTNGGASWSNVLAAEMVDVDFHPTDSTKAVASGKLGNAFYSTNGGASWTAATGLSGSGRIEIAYAPSSPTTVYASQNLGGGSFYASADGGQTYTLRFNATPHYLGSQGWYGNALWVNPLDPNFIVVGGIDLYKSTNGGTSFVKISAWQASPNSAHADHHMIVSPPGFDNSGNKTVFFGNDGGLYKATDISTVGGGGAADCSACTSGWTSLNNSLGITQFYGASGHPASGKIVGGTQDNGTLLYTPGGGTSWTTTFGGDGGYSAYHPTDVNVQYGEYVNLAIHRSLAGGAAADWINGLVYSGGYTCKAAPYKIGDGTGSEGCDPVNYGSGANFIAPFVLDPSVPNRLLAGGMRLWRTNDANTPNTSTTGPSWAAIKPSMGSNISAIAVSSIDSDVVWVGHNNGDVYKTTNGTAVTPTWIQRDNTSPALPNRDVTRITIDPTDKNIVYVTFGGYSGDNLYRTMDGGATWTSIVGSGVTGLPAVPIRDLEIHPANSSWLYAATEVGLFVSETAGATWMLPQDGPANVSVDELFFMGTNLVAVTHGRGVFKQGATTNATVSGQVTNAAGGAGLQGVAVTLYTAAGFVAGSGASDASGNYSVSLPMGTYYASTSNGLGFVNKIYNSISCVSSCDATSGTAIVANSSTVTGINFALNAGARIAGSVINTTSSVGIPSATVLVYGSTGLYVGGAITDASGNYSTLGGFANGTYYVRTSAATAGYVDEVYNNIVCLSCAVTGGTPVVVASTATVSGINFSLLPGGTIAGVVTNASTSAKIQGLSVFAYDAGGTFVGTAATDASGNYSVRGLPTGSYRAATVFASTLGFEDQLYQNIPCASGCSATAGTPIAVTAPGTTSAINFALPLYVPQIAVGSTTVSPGGTITATLTDGPGIATNWVALFCPTSQPDGTYLDWKRLNNTQTTPVVGLTTATITFTAPSTVGTACNLRWFSLGAKIATSVTITVAVINPVPTVTTISPPSVAATSPQFTLTVNGTNFVAGSIVQVDGAARTTTFGSSTQLTATIPGTDVASVLTRAITVFNPTPGGGSSNSATLTVSAPPAAPTLTNISPTNVSAGGAAFPLVVTGTNFFGTSVVRVDGVPRATVFGSATQLTATVLASDIASGGTHAITVSTPSPGGGNSSAATLTVVGPTLTVASTVNPGATISVTVANGPGINTNWVGLYCPSTQPDGSYVDWKRLDNTQVTPAVGLTNAVVTFTAPTTVGQVCDARLTSLGVKIATSGTITVAVNNPVPTVTTISPPSVAATSPQFTLTVNGTNFVPSSIVQVDGVGKATIFGSSTQLTATILGTDVTSIGTRAITVFNPAPGGGSSNSATLTVTTAPAPPTLTNISPTSVSAGGVAFPLTVTGTNFVGNSVVQVDGTPRVTTFGSATSLTATILASDIASGGTHTVTVMTPSPGGGTSGAATLTVVGPTLTVASTVNPGATISVTVANGPGINTNWVGLYCPSTQPDSTYVDWKRLDNTQVTPAVGLTNAVVTFTAPLTVGQVCNARLTSLGVKIATSGTITVVVSNPVPAVTTIAPPSVAATSPQFTLTVNGSNFVPSSIVQVDGVSKTTTFGSATQLTATILDTDVTSIGTRAITVFNPAPGGGSSNSATLTVSTPPAAPTLTNISPTNVSAGGAAFPLVVTGTNFFGTSVVRVDGVARATVFGSATQLTATVLASDIASGGTHAITVSTPAPGGGNSSAATLTVVGPTLTVAATVNPGATISVTVANGPGINTNWVGLYCPSTQPDGSYVDWKRLDNTQVTPAVGLTDAVVTFTAPLTVGQVCNARLTSLGVKIATSGTITVAISNPVPTVTTISPPSVAATSPQFALTVNGSNFVAGSVVQVNGANRATTFGSATQLTATILDTDVTSVGTRAITVFNPAPGGGSSNSATLTISAPPAAPTLTNISPTNVSAGGASFPLVVTGTSFAGNSVVRIDGVARATAFGSATQLTATVLASDIASGGTHAITVSTPAPGGGNSSAATLTVVGPTLTVAATVNPGATISVTVANGPGINTNWVGLYCPSTQPDDQFVDWKRLDNTQVTPLVGLTNAVVTFTAPLTVGQVCNARLTSLGVKIATSGTITVAVSNPVPAVTTISPPSVAATSSLFTLTVNGSNFVAGSVVQVDGVGKTTFFGSSTQLTATIPAPDVATIGTRAITVFNPAPAGGSSNTATLTVSTPPAAPTLTSISPTNVSAGGASFPLTVTGTNFAGNSVVQLDGVARATTFGSATSLTATILASDISGGGTHAIRVFTPSPGGGTTGTATLTVNAPTITGPSSVAAGGTMTFNLTNGPGIATNWVALFCPATQPDDTYLDWKRLNNTQVTPVTGLTTATITFAAPATAGVTCNIRWISVGVKIATSPTVTVTPCPDTDNDRLCDIVETNTGVYVSTSNTGTNPNNPDTDGDGIKDGDEVHGTLGGLNLPGMGASPLKKNILIEYDWVDDSNTCSGGNVFHTHRPTQAIVDRVSAAFLASTNTNPDGTTGIKVIHDFGQGGLFTGGNALSHAADITGGVNGTDFMTVKNGNFAANRAGYFHYVELAHTYGGGNSSGQAELPGNDLIVTMGCSYENFQNTEFVANTIMHELGHNLGLRHGGNEDCNWKPNYNSVMNYRYQFYGVDANSSCNAIGDIGESNVLNFSTGSRPSLNENSLNENAGVCGLGSGVPIDWNFSGTITTPVVFDLNQISDLPGPSTATDNTFCSAALSTLTDYNDWANISFNGLGDSDGATFYGAIMKLFQQNIDCDNPSFARIVQPFKPQ